MTKKYINNWIMYHEIHKLKRMGFSIARIAIYLVLNPRTVSRYLKMSEDSFEQKLICSSERKKILDNYEEFIKEKLSVFIDTSSAQIHDWLKENHSHFPEVSPRTVYNYVAYIRQKYNIPYIPPTREFFPIEELPYGKQSQVDFGEFNMRLQNGKRKKVHFFAMVLSRSRMKFTWFLDSPFTSQAVIESHEKSFEFFQGVPEVVVYDQDRTMVVDENLGDIILTTIFKQYTKTRNFELHFCRKSDPQSKGKVENVIQYIKKNFLYNRLFHDTETLNQQAIAWLARTANHLPHNYTKKSPMEEFEIEKDKLKLFTPLIMKIENKMKEYHVRKTNVIAYKGNFYTLPQGSYKGVGTKVLVSCEENIISIFSLNKDKICSHQLSNEKGKTIANTNHKRDNSQKLQTMFESLVEMFTNKKLAEEYLLEIKKQWPRYARDHYQVINKSILLVDKNAVDKALDFCHENKIIHGYEFEEVLNVFISEQNNSPELNDIMPLGNIALIDIEQDPKISNIEDYENIINN